MPNPCPHVNSTSIDWDSMPGTILVSGDIELLTQNDRFKNKIKEVSTPKLKSLPEVTLHYNVFIFHWFSTDHR